MRGGSSVEHLNHGAMVSNITLCFKVKLKGKGKR
jgi:hypothetical protein